MIASHAVRSVLLKQFTPQSTYAQKKQDALHGTHCLYSGPHAASNPSGIQTVLTDGEEQDASHLPLSTACKLCRLLV